jgi:hypothetical protein
MSFDADVLAMLADFGVPVAYGAHETRGILDVQSGIGISADGMEVETRETVLHVPQAWVDALPSAFGQGAALTIAGTSYVVRQQRPRADERVLELVVVEG